MKPAHKVGTVHPHDRRPCVPEAAHDHAENGGLDDEVILLIHLAEEFGLGTETARGQRIQTAAGAHDQTVHHAEAAHGNERIHDGADDAAENLGKGDARQRFTERPGADDGGNIAHAAHGKDVYAVKDGAEQSAHDQSERKVTLGIFELGVDGGGDDPALIRKRKGGNAGENGLEGGGALHGGGIVGGVDVVEHVGGGTGGETDDRADDCHEDQRDELNDGHGDLQLAGELRGKHIDAVADHQEARAETERLGRDGAGDKEVQRRNAAKLAEKDGGKERKHRCKTRIVDRGHKPADIIGILGSERNFGIVNDTVDLLVFGAEFGKGKRADDADQTDDTDDQDALSHVALRQRQNLTALDKDAGTDHDADDHGDGGRQTVALFHFAFQWFHSLLTEQSFPPVQNLFPD